MMKFKLLALAICSLMAGNVFADNVRCKYTIKFKAKGIQDTNLQNGKIMIKGWGIMDEDEIGQKINARHKECVEQGLNSKNPSKCKGTTRHGKKKVSVREYALRTSIKDAVFAQACDILDNQPNGSSEVTGINIWTKLGTTTNDNGCKGNTFTIASNLKTKCGRHGSVKATKQSYQNRTSKYYNKSASQLQAHIKNFCKKEYSMDGNPTIHKWLMNKKNGYLAAKYTCKN